MIAILTTYVTADRRGRHVTPTDPSLVPSGKVRPSGRQIADQRPELAGCCPLDLVHHLQTDVHPPQPLGQVGRDLPSLGVPVTFARHQADPKPVIVILDDLGLGYVLHIVELQRQRCLADLASVLGTSVISRPGAALGRVC